MRSFAKFEISVTLFGHCVFFQGVNVGNFGILVVSLGLYMLTMTQKTVEEKAEVVEVTENTPLLTDSVKLEIGSIPSAQSKRSQ